MESKGGFDAGRQDRYVQEGRCQTYHLSLPQACFGIRGFLVVASDGNLPTMKRTRTQRGAANTMLIAIVVAIVVVIALFFLLRDQGKDDKTNQPGLVFPQIVLLTG